MKLQNLGSNKTSVELNHGIKVYFSYNTPVVAEFRGELYKTNKKWSVTTSKHINQFLDGRTAKYECDQDWFDELVK